jgi:signal transduction histidine kinase
MTIIPLYAGADYVLYRDDFFALLVARLSAIIIGIGGLVAIRSSLGRRFPDAVGLTVLFAFLTAASAIPALLVGYAVSYYVGFIIAVFGMALLLPGAFARRATLGFGVLALYVVPSLLHGAIDNVVLFACNVSFIGAALAFAWVSMEAGERISRREFGARIALEETSSNEKQLVAALAEQTVRLESRNAEMDDLLYVASHDLRAPLINVQGFSRELQMALTQLRSHNGKSPENNAALADIDESLHFILAAVARMDGLITSLLNVSRIGTRTNPTEQVDLQALARRLTESFHTQLAEKRITLEIDPLPTVTGDAGRLEQLFSTLIDNAIKYMGASAERHIQVGARGDNGDRVFFVHDTGPGILKQHQEQIFRLFRRLATGECPGEGVGLSMARRIVEKHGGRIWVDSAPGAGTTLWFSLQKDVPILEDGGIG